MLALLGLFLVLAAPAPPAPRTEVVARLDPAIHRLEATAVVATTDARATAPVFEINARLQVREVACDGKRVAFEVAPAEGDASMSHVTLHPEGEAPRRCIFRYEGEIHDPPRVAQFSRERIADQTRGTIQSEGVFLAPESGWYPRASRSPASFRLEVHLPAGWDAVAEGTEKLREAESTGMRLVFEAVHPTQGLHLVASGFKRVEADHRGVKGAAFVHPEDRDLADGYVAGVERSLDLYSEWLGPYPYDRFAVVENFFSTGYGMAGFTVLGQDVMRLPFIVDTSLGHEVAHNWWGNGVFVDEAGGNWCEGLATLVADYHARRLQGEGAAAEYRREVCRDYTNYVERAGSDFPLSEFTERTSAASRAVGYGKTMMVFHMLERRLGKERFDEVLRRVYRENLYRAASWDTWRSAFSKEAQEDLGWFFDQWIRKPGAPVLGLSDFSVKELPGKDASRFEVQGTLLEKGGVFRLDVPLVFEGEGKVERKSVEALRETTVVRARLPFRPTLLRVDPDQDVFRRLDPEETPPVLSRLLGDPQALIVVDDTSGQALLAAYREVAESLTRSGLGEIVEASRATSAALRDRNVFLLGLAGTGPFGDLLTGLPGEVKLEKGAFTVEGTAYGQPGASLLVVARHPADPSRAVALFQGLTADAVRAAGKKLVHYGKYTYLAFLDGKNQAKGVAKVEGGPLVLRLEAQTPRKVDQE